MLRRHLTFPSFRATAAAICLTAAVASAQGADLPQPQQGYAPEPGNKVRMLFRFGFSAYKKGQKDEAYRAYSEAAEQGHPGARWKLAHMYAAGDGVAVNDYEAFKLFEGIVNAGTTAPDSQDTSYIANAMVALASYVRRGIPGTPVNADAGKARDLYWQAAANFGEPNAQFELGRMFLNGEGGKADVRVAARWFNLAAEKGHAGAQAMLGSMLFERGQTVRGLSMMTAALAKAQPRDHEWIRGLQEEAFAVASEADRRTAMVLAEELAAQ